MDRREWLKRGGAAALGTALDAPALARPRTPSSAGRLKQSVCRWAFGGIALPELCKAGAAMGLAAIDLLQPADWERVRAFGLVCSMGYPADRKDFIALGFNDPAHHAQLLGELEAAIPLAARHGVPNVITMFGNRGSAADTEAIANCVTGLNRIKALAEAQGVTVCVELLNSKVDHHGYQGDRTAFGVAVMKGVNSPRVKLLYDIYHMQIMEGDVIRTIRDNINWIGHFHTGGVPGRHEINAGQELNYHAIAAAIADLGYAGYVAHEFVPTRADPYASLADAFRICSV